MEEKDDEEISLDFSKIKKIFKGKKEKPKEEVEEEKKEAKEEDEEDISIDLGKVKNFFKKKIKEEKPVEKVEKDLKKEEKTEEKKEVKEESEVEEKEEPEDEELSFDFSKVKDKIKGVFKDKEGSEVEVKKKGEEDSEEVSFDFSKIKNIFKKKKGEVKDTEEGEEISVDTQKSKISGIPENSEEGFSLDFKKTLGFLNKNKKILLPILIIIIGMSFSIHFRLYSLDLPMTEEWAKGNIVNFNKQVISAQINQLYPNLPDQNKKKLINDELQNLLNSGKVYIPGQEGLQQVSYKEALREYSKSFKSRLQDESGQTYLLAIDPYFWMRHTNNVLENGHPGDEIRDGKQWDTYMLAPNGRPLPKSDMFHAYFQAYLYKFLHFFNRGLQLKNMIFYVPILLSALAIIPVFFIGRRVGGNFGGLIAAIILAIHPSFLGRTAGGFADTDAYNVLLPLIITWIFLESFEAKEKMKKMGLVVLAGFFCGVYSFTWLGWWYIFDFLIAAIGIYLLYYVFTHRLELKKNILNFIKQPAVKNTLTLAILFFISSLLFVTLFTNFNRFVVAFSGPQSIVTLHEVGITTIWPNVFTTVAEQNEISIKDAINHISMGQRFLFFIAILGIILTLLKKDIHGKIDIKYAAILTIWFVGALFASTRGVRFVLLLVPAFSIALGVGLGIIYQYITRWATKEIGINKYISKISVFIVLSLLLISPIKSAGKVAEREIPSMDDAWYNSLKRIDLNAEPDAIINSWWDFGHWFKMIGNRAVTFDGTSQNLAQAHWIGNVLLTNDETRAIGILRMLDCSATKSYIALKEMIEDEAKSVDILYEIIVLDKIQAKIKLKGYGLTDEEADLILSHTHCSPPENYFITSQDMIGKSGVWAHFGSWNFNRALIYNTLKKKEYRDLEKAVEFLQNRFNYTREKSESVYYDVQSIADSKEANSWIAPWPSYASGVDGCSKLTNDSISCSISNARVEINLTTMEADIDTPQGVMHPNSLVYPTEDGIVEKKYEDTVGVSLVLIPEGDGYRRLLTAPQLAASMFTRLFFMEGHGLKHFEKFSDESGIYGERIIIWKVDWNGTQENVLDVFKEPEPIEEEEVEQEVEGEINETELESEPIIEEEIVNETEQESQPVIEEDISNETELETILDEIVSEANETT